MPLKEVSPRWLITSFSLARPEESARISELDNPAVMAL
jgi:hypothetical protein